MKGFFLLLAPVELIEKYFPDLTVQQRKQFELLYNVYIEWNQKINVISRKDIEFLYLKHVLHSLIVAKLFPFNPGTTIIDIGTGGGFPGIPLAIYFPDADFYLIDSIGKKIKVANEVIKELDLKNVMAEQQNAKFLKKKFDFSISRAVAPLSDLVSWSKPLIKNKSGHSFKNGLICLKGGSVESEITSINEQVHLHFIHPIFPEDYFKEKFVMHVGLN